MPHDRVVTVPNLLSAARLVAVPFFLWAILDHHDLLALVILMVSGATDWLDGKIARRWHLQSRLGELLDPAADRLYIFATLVGLAWREIIPWWLLLVLVAREVVVALLGPVIRLHGLRIPPVHFLGKAATLCLLYAFPLLLVAGWRGWLARACEPIGWAFAGWGIVLYWVVAALYVWQVLGMAAEARRRPAVGARA